MGEHQADPTRAGRGVARKQSELIEAESRMSVLSGSNLPQNVFI